jgi:O-antigen ligase
MNSSEGFRLPGEHAFQTPYSYAQPRSVSVWAILLVATGLIVVLADGFTRLPNTEWETTAVEPLEYEAYHGAFYFAALTLPLMFLYGASIKASRAESLFLWFLFCTTAYTKDFSYLRLPGAPVFVTDVTLAILVVSKVRLKQWRQYGRFNVVMLGCLGLAGTSAMARGILGGEDKLLVFRDYVIVIYPLFMFVAMTLFSSWAAVKRALLWMMCGAGLSALNGLAWFLVAPNQRRLILYGIYLALALVGVLVGTSKRLISYGAAWPLVLLFSVGVLLANARSLFVAIGIGLLTWLIVRRWTEHKTARAKTLRVFALTACIAATVLYGFSQTTSGERFIERTQDELVSGVLHATDDPNMEFRLLAWGEALARFFQHPLTGEGFGVPFVFSESDADPRPHNTFLTVLYKMGIVGEIALVGLLTYFVLLTVRALKRRRNERHVSYLHVILVLVIAFCTYGVVNLLLESPFLASVFWTLIGLGFGSQRLFTLASSDLLQSHAD